MLRAAALWTSLWAVNNLGDSASSPSSSAQVNRMLSDLKLGNTGSTSDTNTSHTPLSSSSSSSSFPSSSSDAAVDPGEQGFFAQIKQNPLFTAGAGVAGLGMGVALMRKSALSGLMLAERYLTVTMEVPSKDRSYHWVLQWISKNTMNTQHIGVETQFKQIESGQTETRFEFVPSPGRHLIWYKGQLIQVMRERQQTMVDLNSGLPWETVTLKTFGRSKNVFYDILSQARQDALKKEEGKTLIYTSLGLQWGVFGRPRRKRPFNSVLLANDTAAMIKNDVLDFLSPKTTQWYVDKGIPYRRGYLLHGPPGCGKTSFIQALAGDLDYNICMLNLNERGLTDDRLNALFAVIPPKSIVLLEDVDAAFVHRDAQSKEYSLTFSGLLNCLDGVASTEERVIFMTTNHIEKLDPALIRPGRVDMRVEIPHLVSNQVELMFHRFYPEVDFPGAAEAHLAHFVERCMASDAIKSVADLQGHLLLYKDSPQGAADGL